MVPSPSTTISMGKKKRAAAPEPSANPGSPLPTTVLTAPAMVTRRIAWLPESTTSRLPSVSSARPAGWLKHAAGPCPSANPACPLPASVRTAPPGVTTRIAWASDTSRSPLEASTISAGSLKVASAPCPSADPASPLPASVLTMAPALDTVRRAWLPISTSTTLPARSTVMPLGPWKRARVPLASRKPPIMFPISASSSSSSFSASSSVSAYPAIVASRPESGI
mmetsp:Transcript_81142/g.131460  ORF Transcript_81142/g.131460 Transcript_81142/m.131460 type:complete len:224 (-) Transcript_81142:159-830(-)